MTTQGPADRLDAITRTHLSQIPRVWRSVVPDDNPPMSNDEVGNTGPSCIAIYSNTEGWIRFITRGQQLGARQQAGEFPLEWTDNAGNNFGLYLSLGGVNYQLIFGLSVAHSVRVYAQAGTYLWGEVIHILAHETDAHMQLFSLGT